MAGAKNVEFTGQESEAMRAAQVAVFRSRVIFNAQPPIDAKTLKRVEKRCAGPLPPALVDLWRTAFGGALDYDLRAQFGTHTAQLSLAELFFPDSDGYDDLWGWLDHEEDLAKEGAEERGEKWRGKLTALPFGGFEYLERVYVLTAPGPDSGSVIAWRQGLPPAWRFHLHQDSQAVIARDVYALFDSLNLEEDPWTADPSSFPRGLEMLEAIDRVEACGEAGRTAAEKLRRLVKGAVLDWRAALANGSIVGIPLLRSLALEAASTSDDLELLNRLKSLGCPMGEPLSGGATPLELALSAGALRVARRLMDEGLPVEGALRQGAHAVDLALARELLAKGAQVDEHSVFAAVDAGKVEVALAMLEAVTAPHFSLQLAIRARQRGSDAEQTASRIEAGTLSSNVSAAEERARAAALYELAARVDPTGKGH